MLSSDWSRMDSCPASNTMYYNIGSKGEIEGEGKNRNRKEGGEEKEKKENRQQNDHKGKTATMAL